MFKKKPNIKTTAPLRSSDWRKITNQIISDYKIELPKQQLFSDESAEQALFSVGVGALRNSLLPDGSLWAKFSTTQGPELKTVDGTVYVGAHTHDDQRILWFKINERIYPTVYTLWRHPGLLPLLHTPDLVLRKIRGGADLMTPGLARGPPFPTTATKGSTVAIASLESPTVPVVLGVCDIDISALSQVHGAKGHAVRNLHWDGDEAWAWSPGGVMGQVAPEHLPGWDSGPEEERSSSENEVAQWVYPISRTDSVVQSVEVEDPVAGAKGHKACANGKDCSLFETVISWHNERSTEDIDEAFRNAFLYAMNIQHQKYFDSPRHSLDFPISQSLLISKFILPYLPIMSAEDAMELQIKRTSWKTPRKFIKALENESLVRSKDRNGGEIVIQEVNFEAPALTTFVPYKLPKKETSRAESASGEDKNVGAYGAASNDSSIGQRLTKLTLLKPRERLAPIFAAAGSSVKTFYLSTELRSVITAYTDSEKLVSTTNKGMVSINPVIASTVLDGQSSLDREVLAKGSIPRDALVDRVMQNCTAFWAILRNDENRDEAKPNAGNAPTIKILLETRLGKKTVTKVSGVEAFFINPQPLADELQKACASSTSVGRLVGSSPKTLAMEIMVQGPQKEIVTQALEKRGVHRSWIEVLDKTKGKK